VFFCIRRTDKTVDFATNGTIRASMTMATQSVINDSGAGVYIGSRSVGHCMRGQIDDFRIVANGALPVTTPTAALGTSI
jgi:hypothetical protein